MVMHFSSVFNIAFVYISGQYLMDSGRVEEGVKVLLKGAEMYPHDFQCLTNAAGALRYVPIHLLPYSTL